MDKKIICKSDGFEVSINSAKKYFMTKNHFHSFYEFYYLLEGTRKHFIDNQTYIFSIGTLAIIPPNTVHQTIDTGKPHARLLFHISSELLSQYNINEEITQLLSEHIVLDLPIKIRIELEEMLVKLNDENSLSEICYKKAIEMKVIFFVIELLRYISKNEVQNKVNHTDSKMHDIIRFIKENYKEQITLASIAEEFFINKNYLSRAFKKSAGFTVMNFIAITRIVEAQKLLISSNLSVVEIALAVGFSNQSSFSKAFKKITSFSPKEYRKANQR